MKRGTEGLHYKNEAAITILNDSKSQIGILSKNEKKRGFSSTVVLRNLHSLEVEVRELKTEKELLEA